MRITILLLVLSLSTALFAQKRNRDVVYLKDGSIVRGTIVLEAPNKLIKLKTADNSLWVFKLDQIDSITGPRPVSVRIPDKTGYFNLTEMGFLLGNYSNATRAPFTLMNINGWYFENGISTGLGVGAELSKESYLPVVADFRYYFKDKRPVPFLSLQAGYSFALGGSYAQTVYAVNDIRVSPLIYPGPVPPITNGSIDGRGGFLINPAIGLQSPLTENLALTISAGYRWMRHSYYRKSDNYKLDVDYNRLSLKIGLLFK
jgi:hypothetical protein